MNKRSHISDNASLEKILKGDLVLQKLKTIFIPEPWADDIYLVGGAIIDIARGTTPKDYDIMCSDHKEARTMLINAGYKLSHRTASADTFIRPGDAPIQILRRESTDDMDFTISQAKYSVKYEKFSYFYINSYNDRTLIPTVVSCRDRTAAANSLARIPLWQHKGFLISDESYLNLVRIATNINFKTNS